MHPCTPEFYDAQAQLAWMDAHGIARQAIAIAPRLFFYDLPGQWNREFCRACNTEILARCAAHPQRFLPVGSLPMQDIPSAVEEVDFLAENGVRMVQIGTTIHGLCLDDLSFCPSTRPCSGMTCCSCCTRSSAAAMNKPGAAT